jgi:NSS family neurotransmitter:Na+ symporter
VSYRWKSQNLNEELSIGNPEFSKTFLAKYTHVALGTFVPVIVAVIFIDTVARIYFDYHFFG